MNHSAYCMMVRSVYPLLPGYNKRNSRPRQVKTAADPIKQKLIATEKACAKRDAENKFKDDKECVDWCVKSFKRKKLETWEVRPYQFDFGDIMYEAIREYCGN